MTGEMSLKERLVNGDRFDTDTFGFSFEADNPIHHEKRKPVRQNLHHLIGVKASVAAGNRPRRRHGASARLLPSDRSSQIRIGGVTGFNCDNMTADAASDQREVADHVENFVAHEFVREPQRFLA